MKKIILNITLVNFLFIFMCSKQPDLPVHSADVLNNKEILNIKQWYIAGPFPLLKENMSKFGSGLYQNDLGNFNLQEDSITACQVNKIRKSHAINRKLLAGDFTSRRVTLELDHIDFNDILDVSQEYKANAYAACIIQSSVEREVVILSGSDNRYKMWLNNKCVKLADVDREILRYQYFTPVHLKKGRNLLFVKISNVEKYWRMVLNVSTMEYARDRFNDWYVSDILQKSILDNTDSLEINLKLYPKDYPFTIRIFSVSGKELLNEPFTGVRTLSLAELRNGLYKCKISGPDVEFEQKIYIGNADQKYDLFKEKLSTLNIQHHRTKLTLETLMTRYQLLLQPEFRGKDAYNRRMWDKKIVFCIHRIQTLLRQMTELNPLEGLQGIHLNSFQSRIDGQTQHYLLHVPKTYTPEKTYPVMIIFPFLQPHPFWKSHYVANIIRLQAIKRLADQYGYLVLMPSSRTYYRVNIHPIFITDTFEVLDILKQDYNIDPNRLYLSGICAGGRMALLFASRFPQLTAAVGVIASSNVLTLGSWDIAKSPVSHTELADWWVACNNPINYIENLKHIPIYLIHGDKDLHTPFEYSTKFVEKANRLGIHPEFKIVENSNQALSHKDYRLLHDVFKFFKNKKRMIKPQTVWYSTPYLKYNSGYWIKINQIVHQKKATIKAEFTLENQININTKNVISYEILLDSLDYNGFKPLKIHQNGHLVYKDIPKKSKISLDVGNFDQQKNVLKKNQHIEGPITHAFADRFIVVQGTRGSIDEQKKIDGLTKEFVDAWDENYYGKCRFVTDVNISQQDIQNFHLILIGNAKTNLLINRIIGHIPLGFDAHKLTIGDRHYEGENKSIHFIYPNPLNPEKYIVIIGGYHIEKIGLGETDLALKGWYDYTVWQHYPSGNSRIIEGGIFNRYWR